MTRKRMKKLLMGKGVSRNIADCVSSPYVRMSYGGKQLPNRFKYAFYEANIHMLKK